MKLEDIERLYRADKETGIFKTGYKTYRLGDAEVRSMLEKGELILLYLAGKAYTGKGAVVDLGPLLGASTVCLASGMNDAGHASAPIDSFDLWHIDGYAGFLSEVRPSPAGSLLGEFSRVTQKEAHRIRAHQGDYLS